MKSLTARINKSEPITLSEIQNVIDHHLRIERLTDAITNLSDNLSRIQRKVIMMIKLTGLPSKHPIKIEDKQHGILIFWIQGSYLNFKTAE